MLKRIIHFFTRRRFEDVALTMHIWHAVGIVIVFSADFMRFIYAV